MVGMIQQPVITALVAVAMAFGGAWAVQGWRYNAQIAEIYSQHAMAPADATQKALEDTIKMQRTKDDAIQQAEDRAKKNALAAAARHESDGLRSQLASVPAHIAGASSTAVAEYANASIAVFAECVGAYQ